MNINFLTIGLKLGLISKQELLIWSDENLLKCNNQDVFIELSSIRSSDGHDVVFSVLDKYEDSFLASDFDEFHSIILSFIVSESGDWQLIQQKLIDYFTLLKDDISVSDFGFWVSLKDDIQLRKEGLPGCLNFPKDLKKYIDSKRTKNYNDTFLSETLNIFS